MVGRGATAGPWGLAGKEPKNRRAEVGIGGGSGRGTKEGTSFIKGSSKTFKWAFQDGKRVQQGGTGGVRRKAQTEEKTAGTKDTEAAKYKGVFLEH